MTDPFEGESMSSMNCPYCGLLCSDTPKGYCTGCIHYPPDGSYKNKYHCCLSCGKIAEDVTTVGDDQLAVYMCYSCQSTQQHGYSV